VFDTGPSWIVGPPSYEGHEGIREGSAVMAEVFSDYRWELLEVREHDSGVVCHLRQRGGAEVIGTSLEGTFGLGIRTRDERISWMRWYDSWEEALAAEGLP
jgi:hypothetical protein